MMQVTFREIAAALERAGSQVMAAESHGCLVGALCTTPDYSLERWLDELVVLEGEDDASLKPDAPLRLLFADTLRALRGQEMEFTPLLPDDEESLAARANALAQWCQGFLYGFGTGNPVKKEKLKGQVDEILRDLTHIARATADVGEAGEDEENSYAELVEYLRVGVQLVHDELAPIRDADEPASDTSPPADEDDDFDADRPDRVH
jgi:uncharacterized protein YgfB (UPF0149 family)